ncbi:amino acid adenylation domain-containing protein [Sphaerisporangium sp. TRM90804]|uniref:amino acid adenylation domain-containing protein n=1 Tax=Sphaerisporangium sp. TRM90804 TaxID=3031113 RepID=UPI002448B0BA|nr:amino acid adenylation domain-containing protein [Sphaerisporangium sp. TRM90804]MDH2424609.1 amino acid adenylation domain-containing protein [Sphaerisporangium sp. TRM90804]
MNRPHLYDWFSAGAEKWPSEIAIEVDGLQLSYRRLEHAVARMAGLINRAHGSRPPRRVGILAARSLAAYAGYLAALRLGATVVPLNPAFPPDRNRLLCDRAGVDVVITDESAAGQVSSLPPGVTLVNPAADAWRALLNGPVPDIPPCGRTNDVAYILFTSGSTGIPKGVPIRHENVAPYLDFNIERYQVGPGCRLSQAFDLTFDPSVFDLFVAWGAGATLVVPRKDELMAPVDFVNARRVTHWFSVPWYISMTSRLDQLTPDSMPGLRWSLFAGEQLTVEQADAWRTAAPRSVIENIYGPTELTVTCTGYRLPARRADWPVTANATVPIGRPYPFMETRVVDESGREAPEGELCVRGPQRFAGYLDSGDDAGRFLEIDDDGARPYDGTAPLESSHWYRTGDRVRWADGELVHLGRLDAQVKINGCRVELGEIEAAVRGQECVREAVVLVVPSARGAMEIVAVYTGEEARSRDLVTSVRRRLPRYMVPSRFKRLASFPLNANGKIDRRRLAEELT